MRALSLWQPWASAMTVLRPGTQQRLKRFETRSWAPAPECVGQRLAICAAKTQCDPDTRKKLNLWWMELVKRQPNYCAAFAAAGFENWEDLPFGAVVCHGILSRVVPTDELIAGELLRDTIEKTWGDYSSGRFAWELSDVVVLDVPRPIVGRQGLFWWDEQEAKTA